MARRSFPGESGLGKSTLMNTLFNTQLYPEKEERNPSGETPKTVDIQAISAGGNFAPWNGARTPWFRDRFLTVSPSFELGLVRYLAGTIAHSRH